MSPAPATAPDMSELEAALAARTLEHADAEREHARAVGERAAAEERERHGRARMDAASARMGAAFTAWRLALVALPVAPAGEG